MNTRKLDKLLVVDLEATCWKGDPPSGQIQDILEIGFVWLDLSTYAISGKRSLLTIPTRSTISPFCTDLTTLTPALLAREGMPFVDAVRTLSGQNVHHYGWASYGDFDRALFEKQCRELTIPFPFSSRHTNIKHVYALLTGAQKEVGMAKALEQLSIPLTGTHHRAHDDAENTAVILAWLLKNGRQGCANGQR